MGYFCRVIAPLAGFIISSIAAAIPVPTGTAADDLIISFDFVSAAVSPPPPYMIVAVDFSFVAVRRPKF